MPARHTIKCYGLSTCSHCRNVKKWLDGQGLDYDFVEVDNLKGEDKQAAMRAVRDVNPNCSFPTILVDESVVIVGFREVTLRQALGL